MGEEFLFLRLVRFFEVKIFPSALQDRARRARGEDTAKRGKDGRGEEGKTEIAEQAEGEQPDEEKGEKYIGKES